MESVERKRLGLMKMPLELRIMICGYLFEDAMYRAEIFADTTDLARMLIPLPRDLLNEATDSSPHQVLENRTLMPLQSIGPRPAANREKPASALAILGPYFVVRREAQHILLEYGTALFIFQPASNQVTTTAMWRLSRTNVPSQIQNIEIRIWDDIIGRYRP